MISDTPCDRCSISARRVAVLGGPTGPLTGQPSSVTRLASGKYIVLTRRTSQPDSMLPVFNADGTFERYLARRGQGPGEVTSPVAIAERPDSTVLVYERGLTHSFSASLRFVGVNRATSNLSSGSSLALLAKDGLAAYTNIGVLDTVYFHRGGQTAPRAFSAPAIERGGNGRVIAKKDVSADARLWVVQSYHENGYSATEYDTSGNRGALLRHKPEWWFGGTVGATVVMRPGQAPAVAGDTIARPNSDAWDAWWAGNGVLLSLFQHSTDSWKGIQLRSRFNGGGSYVSVVEAVDTKTGRLIGRADLHGFPVALIGGLQVVTYREDADGFPYVDVWQLTVAAPPSPARSQH
jgi:hypothetical protein